MPPREFRSFGLAILREQAAENTIHFYHKVTKKEKNTGIKLRLNHKIILAQKFFIVERFSFEDSTKPFEKSSNRAVLSPAPLTITSFEHDHS